MNFPTIPKHLSEDEVAALRVGDHVRLGVVDAAAWRNTDDAGKNRGMSISLTKRYRDAKEEQWKNSRCYLSPHEVAAANAVLTAIQQQLLDLDPTTAGNTEA